jgi:colanic acid biosynthesis protein WcaH
MIPAADYKKFLEQMPVVCIDAIIMNNKGQYLLIKRKNEPLKGDYWVPGGRLLKNETLNDAVLRKVKEELGIESHVVMPIGVYEDFFDKSPLNPENGLHTISIVYLIIAGSENICIDEQSDDWGWFDELPERLKKMTTFNTLGGLLN